MKVVVIGGTGHVGTYLIPRLVQAGHQVICVSRGESTSYLPHRAWDTVERIMIDRSATEQDGTFGALIAELQPDVVIDMICFTLESCQHLVDALRGKVQHFLHCGTIWIHGHSAVVPTTEDAPRQPFGDYGIQKSAIESYLMDQARRHHFPTTAIHPGHIVGPGHIPINPVGNKNLKVYQAFADGDQICLPNLGLETLHHVHADDVAQLFMLAMSNWSLSVGESFHVVSSGAMTTRGYAQALSTWFGHEADLTFLSWDEWKTTVSEAESVATWDHIAHSPNASIAKAIRMLNYHPRYTSLEAVFESVDWLIKDGQITV